MTARTKASAAIHRHTTLSDLGYQQVSESWTAANWPPVWWVGCHGGAGTTTLARVVGLGVDAGTCWPYQAVEDGEYPTFNVVLVCRATASGTWAAMGAVEQWKSRQRVPPNTNVLGVAAVQASRAKPPRIAQERLELLRGWVPKMWPVDWVEEYLAADDPRDIGMPPDVAALRAVVGLLVGERVP